MPNVQLTAKQFARKQNLKRFSMWSTCGIVWGLASLILTKLTELPLWISATVILLPILAAGAGGIPSLLDAVYLMFKGFPRIPRKPWEIEFAADEIKIRTDKYEVRVPNSTIVKAELWVDECWDRVRGIEDQFIKIFLMDGGNISVPGTSNGFRHLPGCFNESSFKRICINN